MILKINQMERVEELKSGSAREFVIWERDKYEELLKRSIGRTKKAKPYRGTKIEKLRLDLESELGKVEKATINSWEEIKRNAERVIDRADDELKEIEKDDLRKHHSL
jgi:hypothetical protein